MKKQINLTKLQFDNWLIALRSGQYTQGRGALKYKTDSGLNYCCLGVLCETNNIPNSIMAASQFYSFKKNELTSSSCLYPEPLVVGEYDPVIDTSNNDIVNIIKKSNTEWLDQPRPSSLSYLNDGLKLNFKDIADIIELSFEPKE